MSVTESVLNGIGVCRDKKISLIQGILTGTGVGLWTG